MLRVDCCRVFCGSFGFYFVHPVSVSRTVTFLPSFAITPSFDVSTIGAQQVQLRQIGPGMVQQLQSACSSCRGEGKVINERDKCKACSAKKVRLVMCWSASGPNLARIASCAHLLKHESIHESKASHSPRCPIVSLLMHAFLLLVNFL